MPGPESRTATRTPPVWVCSVLINNSRGPASTELIASTAFRIKFRTTCCKLNTIPLNGKQPLRKAGLDRDSILGDCASRQYNHLVDRLIEIKTILSRRRFLDVITDPVDDISGSIGIAHDTVKRFPDFAQVGRLLVQEIQGRTGVVARGGDRLRDFVSQRGGQFSQLRSRGSCGRDRTPAGAASHARLRAHDCCHIGAGAAIATEFSVGVKHWLAAGLHIHGRAVTARGAIYEVTERFT